jgi:hypothetical protein
LRAARGVVWNFDSTANQRQFISMAFLFSPASCVASSSTQNRNRDAFARVAIATSHSRHSVQKRLAAELSTTGFVACALTAALLGSTPGIARADSKKTAPQTCVAKSTGVASVVARSRISSLNTLKTISASSRDADSRDADSRDDDIVVESLPEAPAPRAAMRLAAASAESSTQTETNPSRTTPDATAESATAETGEPLTATIGAPATGSTPGSAPDSETVPNAETAPATDVGNSAATGNAAPSRLYAPSISYEGGTIIAQGTPENPVRLESKDARIIAQSVRLDTVAKTVSAQGKVQVERQITLQRYSAFSENGNEKRTGKETITETLQGEDFEYNYETRQGQLGETRVRLANFNIAADSLVINGQKYIARNVVVRPGGLSDEERKIYGTPPFNLRAREFTVDLSKPATTGAGVSDTGKDDSASVDFSGRAYAKGAALYFKNTRLLPVPSAFLNRSFGRREEKTYQITPRISTNSSDGILVTTKLYFPIARTNPERLSLAADIGLSTKIGFRGGVQLESSTGIGDLALGARVNDIVETQLTNRIELDRLPELQYRPPELGLFDLPGGRRAGLKFGFIAGDYRERFTDGSREVRSSRLQGQVRFTTRLARTDGVYLDLFARASKYSDHFENLRTAGFEIGYSGPLTRRLSGQFSYSATTVSGSTPFRFDEIEIRKELRATFDILLTPRYIIPVDLRYDVDRGDLRDTTIGLLRNYKTFAYGVTYQSARREIKLEIRQGF